MRKILWVLVLFWVIGFNCLAAAGIFDDIVKELPGAKSGVSQSGLDQKTTVSGLNSDASATITISASRPGAMPPKTLSRRKCSATLRVAI